ncbi:MAG: chorismate-binding protein [Gemmatimonadota bacterium]|nr:chorismate-binding protein [Gemmatimonadota bacterium]
MNALLRSGFVFEYAPNALVVGLGPFAAAASRRGDTLACYAPDFFGDEPCPWLHPASWRVTTRRELLAALGDPPAPPVAVRWSAPDADAYDQAFHTVMAAIARGELTKAVPVILERGRASVAGAPLLHRLLTRVLEVPPASLVYGVWDGDHGMVGASPEFLFRRLDGARIDTAAIAGTAPPHGAEALLTDPKELAEHQSVVDDLIDVLARYGHVTVGVRDVLTLPHITHLRTPLSVGCDHPPDFAQVARAMHPTAALGVAPRRAGLALLRALDRGVERGRFGAPFGIEWPDGQAACLVAIRNVQWRGHDVALGVGGGVIAQSTLNAEWEELRMKRDAVKDMLGL